MDRAKQNLETKQIKTRTIQTIYKKWSTESTTSRKQHEAQKKSTRFENKIIMSEKRKIRM